MINVESEINKHRSCRDRDELERHIQDYKNLARQHAMDFTVAGQYNMVAHKLQEICDKLPAPRLKNVVVNRPRTSVKTATITKEENAQIKAAWQQRAEKGARNDIKR